MRRAALLFVLVLVLAAALAACGAHAGAGAGAPPKSAARAGRPAVVLTIVVDQLAGWIAEERLPLLPESGGFARLRREGTWEGDVRYDHAVTDTAPGHAALYAALPPRESGVFANEILDPRTRRPRSILRDPSTHVVSSSGERDAYGSSLAALTGETVADRLRAERPESFIVSLSLKDRGAIFGGGRRPDATLWFDPREGGFVTSTAFGREIPPWAKAAAGEQGLAAAAAKPWTLLDEAFVRAHAETADETEGEGDAAGLGRTFPHPAPASLPSPLVALRFTPAADELLLALGLAAVDARKARPMLLALSLSTHDYVAHVWGPDSWEAWDELVRLDAALGRFFAALDARVGADGWAVVLSADHGSTSMPEVAPRAARCGPGAAPDRRGRPCAPGKRVDPLALHEELDAAARKVLGRGDWILGVADPYVYFTRDALAEGAARRQALDAAVRAALARHPEVASVTEGGRRGACEPGESLDALVCRSLAEGTRGALYVALGPGSFFDSGYALGRGSSHGSAYAYDRSVPLLVRGGGAARGAVVTEPRRYEDFARAACAALGISAVGAAPEARDFAPASR